MIEISNAKISPIPGFSSSTCPHPPVHSSYPNQLYQQLQQQPSWQNYNLGVNSTHFAMANILWAATLSKQKGTAVATPK